MPAAAIISARRILIATDGSPGALHAARWAAATFGLDTDDIILLTVVEPPARLGRADIFLLPNDAIQDAADQSVDEAVAAIAATRTALGGRPARGAVMQAAPADGILRAIEWFRPDAVVLGKRGLGRLGRRLLGSVSAAVAARSPVPVFVVPTPLPEDRP
jgi:nucleotide-binding universal stress UspA family protein